MFYVIEDIDMGEMEATNEKSKVERYQKNGLVTLAEGNASVNGEKAESM